MKITRNYFVLAVLVALAFLGKFYLLGQTKTSIDEFRGGNLKEDVWNPLFANDMNSNLFTISIDSHEYTNTTSSLFVNDKREVMVPISLLRDAMNCSVHVYDDTVLIEKRNISVTVKLGETEAICDGEIVELTSPLYQEENEIYISLNDLSFMMQYNEKFSAVDAVYAIADSSESTSIVPSRYDLREKQRVSVIKNQGVYGTCWAIASTSALESSLLPEKTGALAVEHMVLANGMDSNMYDGGTYMMSIAYLAAWNGPVFEADDEYGDKKTDDTLKPVYHVQGARIIEGKDYEAIKEAVFKFGGVQSSIYSTIKSTQGSTQYYNKDKAAYCYIGTEKPNHDIVIIGWDDNYPKENFNLELEGDGAFICQNSWGESFGENGVFYISYYDTNIGSHGVYFSRVDSVDNYDNIYQCDIGGWVSAIGYDKESAYGANVYTAKKNEMIKAAGFYATGAQTEYEVYVVRDFKDETSFANAQKVAEGVLEQAGYYTVDFNYSVKVSSGERFAIVVYVKTPGSKHPLAMENHGKNNKSYQSLDLDDGEGYMSYNGRKFTNVKELENCNLCIKAFTDNRKN